ncbi:transcription factor ICE1-like isoform X1 [Physcomitrium patens]|uniref:transcription factor ICE1-like isoform X1 n=1 Tax=Physcomitrium patens TaxID=3218 RepID=UPI003CCD5A0E
MGKPVECSDAVGVSNHADLDYSSDLTDVENYEEECGFVHRTLEIPKSRSSGVFVDSAALPELRLRLRIHEHFRLSQEVLLNSCTDEIASILTKLYEYIEKLQTRVKELDSELDSKYSRYEDDWVCSGDGWSPSYKEEQRPVDLNAPLETGFVSCSQPTVRISQVEVMSTKEGLKIHIECEKRPGLLRDIMELLESRGLNVEKASVAFDEHFVLDCVGSEIDGRDNTKNSPKSCLSAVAVGASLVSLIAKQRDAASP